MITCTSLEVTSTHQELVLAPFDDTHLAAVLPVPVSVIANLSAESRPYFTTHDPSLILEEEQLFPHSITWGIFDKTGQVQMTSPEAFRGMIALHPDKNDGEPTKIVQEISTVLMREEYKRRGVGTLAKLAVAKYAFSEGAFVLRAETATRNVAEQHSLVKAGFTRLDIAKESIELADGGKYPLEHWWLMNDAALKTATQEPRYEELVLGWQAYQLAVEQVQVRPLSL